MAFFHLTATWGLNRGGAHPKIWALFFLGGHSQELFFQPPHWIFTTSVRRGGGFFPPDSDIGAQQERGATLKFGRYFSLVGIVKNFLLSSPLYLYHEFKEGSWIFFHLRDIGLTRGGVHT